MSGENEGENVPAPDGDTPDDEPDEELFNPNEELPDDEPNEEPEKNWEYISPEGEPMKPTDSPEVMEIRSDLESWGYPCEPEEDNSQPESEPELESNPEYDLEIPEIEPEQEPEKDPERELELINPETGERIPSQVNPNEELGTVPDLEPESESKIKPEEVKNPDLYSPDPEQESDVRTGQESIKPQKKKPIEVKKIEKISEELVEQPESEPQKEPEATPEEVKQEAELKEENESHTPDTSSQELVQEIDQEKAEETKDFGQLSDEEKYELYRQETGKRPLYAEKETRGYKEWDEQRQTEQNIKSKDNDQKHEEEEEHKEIRSPTRTNQSNNDEIVRESPQDTPKVIIIYDYANKTDIIIEIHEEREEWEQYLIEKINAQRKISGEEKANLIRNLNLYHEVDKISQNVRDNKISQEQAEKELERLEKHFSDNLQIEKEIFKNFKIYENYYKDLMKRSDKRSVEYSLTYKTNKFISSLSNKFEQMRASEVSKEQNKEEKWAQDLETYIIDAPNQEISDDIKKTVLRMIRTHAKFNEIFDRGNLSKDQREEFKNKIQQFPSKLKEIFKQLGELRVKHQYYSDRGWEQSIQRLLGGQIKKITELLENIQSESKLYTILNDNKKFKENLKQNLYKSTEMSLDDKSKIVKIIQKEKISKTDEKEIISILNGLSSKELDKLFSKNEKTKKSKLKYYLELKSIAESKNGIIISTEYINSRKKYEFICEKGHIFQKYPQEIKKGYWCKKCLKINYLKEMEQIAKKRGGKLISTEYKNALTPLIWECDKCSSEEKPFRWSATPADIKGTPKRKGTWCPKCAGKLKYNIEDMKKIAISKNGFCLSNNYENIKIKLLWKCSECGMVWKASPDSIINQGTWCPRCGRNGGYSERVCRKFFKEIFGKDFRITKFEWLINDDGFQMHLDGFNFRLKIAFEYNGIQHYIYNEHFYKSKEEFEKRKRDDKEKVELCKKNGIKLIIIPYYISFDEMEEYIRKECDKLKITTVIKKQNIDWRQFDINPPDKIKEMQKSAEEIGMQRNGFPGKCLSNDYFGRHTPLKWECGNPSCQHQWWATPNNIINHHRWCPKCAGKEHTIEDMKLMAAEKLNGGQCLSKKYKGAKVHLKWKCGTCGNEWMATPDNIRGDKGCPNWINH
ncbi:MAG: hypothetical protein ACFFDF_07955 [Candidatus Odinarchaeota archaeon]